MAFHYGKPGKAAKALDKIRRGTVSKSPSSARRSSRASINRASQSQLERLGYADKPRSRAPKTGR